ncbi:hypothetical protein J6X96_00595 [bacterium]|nr:hypothetical protein [bacterium]
MKKALALFLLIACTSLFAEDVSVKPAGEGTAESPYLFDSLENFFWLRKQTSEMDPNVPVYCKQIKDIDASATQQGGDYAWSDINFSQNNLFVYDGQEYTIYGLEPNEKGALFGTGYMQLKNIRIQGAEGIKTCALAKNLSSDKSRNGCFENCYIKGLLVETPALADTVRGMFIKIEDCIVEADIEIKNEKTSSGALINFMYIKGGTNSVRKTCFKGKVKTKPLSHVCGLTVTLTLGSVLNNTELKIEDCYTDLTVECDPDDRHTVTGLIGAADMSIYSNVVLSIERCYTTCEASESMDYGAAYIYQLTNTVNTLNIKGCYYREAPHFTDDYAIGKTDEEMKQQATFENWDFENVWDIDEGKTMPYFISELPEPTGMAIMFLMLLVKIGDSKITKK